MGQKIRYNIVRIDDANTRQVVGSCATAERADAVVAALASQFPDRKYVVELESVPDAGEAGPEDA